MAGFPHFSQRVLVAMLTPAPLSKIAVDLTFSIWTGNVVFPSSSSQYLPTLFSGTRMGGFVSFGFF